MVPKQCGGCGVEKIAEEFRLAGEFRRSLCRPCERARKKDRRSTPEQRAKIAAYNRSYSGVAVKVVVDQKPCTRCHQEKPAKAFGSNKLTRDDLTSWCLACYAAYAVQRRKDPEVKRREALYAKSSKSQEYRRRYSKSENRKAAEKRFYASEAGRLARRRSKERRRAMLAGVRYDLDPTEWKEMLRLQLNCFYCKRLFSPELQATQDHRVAISRCGDHTKGNVVASCLHCNQSKGTRDLPVTNPDRTPYDPCWLEKATLLSRTK